MTPRVARRQPAFTLIELLIVLGIIVVLLALLMPGFGRMREQSRRTSCASNLRQIGAAMIRYATENNGKLPQHDGPAEWLTDLPKPTRDALLTAGATRGLFYCASNEQVRDVDTLWNYPTGKADASSTRCVTGYQFLTRRPTATALARIVDQRKYLTSITDTITVTPPPGTTPPSDRAPRQVTSSSEIEVATDLVAAKGASVTENFFGAHRTAVPNPFPTSHTSRGKPAGGNILFLDGHVGWRDFSGKGMKVQHVPGDGNRFYF